MAMIDIPVPGPYDFHGCLHGHGWMWLEPFTPTEEGFRRVLQLASDKVVEASVTAAPAGEDGDGDVDKIVRVDAGPALTPAEADEVAARVRWMLRLDEDFSDFYHLCRERGDGYEAAVGRGRLLRSPTLFEDAIKVLFTTNTTWRQTKQMVARTVAGLGAAAPDNPQIRAFPTPEAVLAAGEAFFAEAVRAGYRALAVIGLAERADELAELERSELPTPDLRKRLLSFRGLGPYSAATLLMLLGRYDDLPVDSEARAFAARHYFDGERPADADIHALYDGWGRWTYLAYALDPAWQA